MNFFFVIFIPILIFILNEYFQNKIFLCFEKFYKYSKIIALFIPFILVYFNPELVKKILIFFKDIDKQPTHQNMTKAQVFCMQLSHNTLSTLPVVCIPITYAVRCPVHQKSFFVFSLYPEGHKK